MPAEPTLAKLDAHLGYWLRMASNAVSQGFARKVEREGVTVAEWVLLRALYDVEGIAPSQLAQGLGLTRGAVSKLADRLLEKSLIERRANPDDKRAQTLALSAAGRRLVPRLAALADQNDADFFDALPSDQRRCLADILRRIAHAHGLTSVPID
ncbi:MarR family winged helix-turn-helix transcriptional regulator [Prosthecodimorpha staleyi]|uniref:MarR family transcriptional regulator n=1 Tax=Prosthecodimorpha staleyi TaxID=2840188 RepID=A0A947GE90_9HYPH|nr:MarR family transcriptional regulator [Prosthecodimorpha staleyi]MBT9291647.1 MarR family transcriptional regulator [Prosthecodimorpha staleyi]